LADLEARARPGRHESRWPVVLAVVVVTGLLLALPERVRLYPLWTTFALGAVVIAPMVMVGLSGGASGRWLRLERRTVVVFSAVLVANLLVNLWALVFAMMEGAGGALGLRLLTSSIAVWVTNVLAFSLLFWQIDRGGPGSRDKGAGPRPDWLFPQDGASPEQVMPGWRPTFIDYLFLGFSTATAFSTTEVAPLTPRAKLLMMIESSISLTTIVIVGARAINILGS